MGEVGLCVMRPRAPSRGPGYSAVNRARRAVEAGCYVNGAPWRRARRLLRGQAGAATAPGAGVPFDAALAANLAEQPRLVQPRNIAQADA